MSSAIVDTADVYKSKVSSSNSVGDLDGNISPDCGSNGEVGSPDSTLSPSHHVGFIEAESNTFENKERERYLTAKYPKHQMGLIRKRLAVEDWVDAELKNLFDITDEDIHTYDTIIDLDELLNLDTDPERSEYIRQKIAHAPKSEEMLAKFTEELLKKANTL